MLYAIIAEDKPNSLENRLPVRDNHLQRLKELDAEGRLLTAGPFPINEADMLKGVTGSLIIADFATLEQAQTWANADPYVDAGVYANVIVKPYKKIFPENE